MWWRFEVGKRVCGSAVLPVVLVGVFVLAAPAHAAFPGRDGLLAVQPSTGPGIVLVNANGRGERRVCAQPSDRCGVSPSQLVRPQWAPDGRTLAIDTTSGGAGGWPAPSLIYSDGSCLACLGFPVQAVDASFTSNPTLYTAVTELFGYPQTARDALVEYGIDGLRRRVVTSGPASDPVYSSRGEPDPVWSARGELALAPSDWIWAGKPGRLRRVAQGGAPSWSPDGRQLAFVRNGWVTIGLVRGSRFRRLVHGTAPAWSPSGRWIAFFDKHHHLSLIGATGGTVRHVGGVTGSTVDWQPLPPKPRAACLPPAGSVVLASSPTAIVTAHHAQPTYAQWFSSAYMGCLRANRRERLLTGGPSGYATMDEIGAALAGPYAALATNTNNSHDQAMSSTLDLFDLRTGAKVPDRGGEEAECMYGSVPPCASTIDQLVLGADAVSAVHTIITNAAYYPNGPCSCTVEQIQASDNAGVRTLDSVTEPLGSTTMVTNLTLNGDTLTWEHNGTPRSAQLQP